jgi:hypothetical protein
VNERRLHFSRDDDETGTTRGARGKNAKNLENDATMYEQNVRERRAPSARARARARRAAEPRTSEIPRRLGRTCKKICFFQRSLL